MNKPGCSGWMVPVFMGGIFGLIGAVMLAWQLCMGESSLPGMIGWVFFPTGSVFVFLGLGLGSASIRRRVVFNTLARGNVAGIVLASVALFVSLATGRHMTPWVEIVFKAATDA